MRKKKTENPSVISYKDCKPQMDITVSPKIMEERKDEIRILKLQQLLGTALHDYSQMHNTYFMNTCKYRRTNKN